MHIGECCSGAASSTTHTVVMHLAEGVCTDAWLPMQAFLYAFANAFQADCSKPSCKLCQVYISAHSNPCGTHKMYSVKQNSACIFCHAASSTRKLSSRQAQLDSLRVPSLCNVLGRKPRLSMQKLPPSLPSDTENCRLVAPGNAGIHSTAFWYKAVACTSLFC